MTVTRLAHVDQTANCHTPDGCCPTTADDAAAVAVTTSTSVCVPQQLYIKHIETVGAPHSRHQLHLGVRVTTTRSTLLRMCRVCVAAAAAAAAVMIVDCSCVIA